MKGISFFLLIAILALLIYNNWEFHQIREDIASVKIIAMQKNNEPVNASDQILMQATRALESARNAIGNSDWHKAKSSLLEAEKYLQQAGEAAGNGAKPALNWLQQQAVELSSQIQNHVKK
jgi:hypothetical protein